MRDRLSDRFRNLERARRPGAIDTVPETDGRIEAIETGCPPASPSVARSHVERFRPPAEPALDIATTSDDAQPFTRCMRCETDSSRSARTCGTCGADLESREQRLFNERLWEQRKKERELEEREAALRERERAAAAEATARAEREVAAEMARRVGDRERERLDRELGGAIPDSTPYGIRLLRAIPNPYWRIGAIAIAVAIPLLLIAFGGRRSGARTAGILLAFLLAGLFSPPGFRHGRRRFWGW